MCATASTALRLQRSASCSAVAPPAMRPSAVAPHAAAPFAAPDGGVLAPDADTATVAVVPRTKARREISPGSDTITSQRLTHAMHGTAAVADHGHIGVVDRQAFRAASGRQILARGRYQYTLLAQRYDVAAQLHGVAVGNRDGADPLRAQPLDEFGLDRFDADDR